MTPLTVIDRGNHCEIPQGDALAADYVASKRLAALFAAAPELLAALKAHVPWTSEPPQGWGIWQEAVDAIAKAEGRSTTEGTHGEERPLDG